MDHCGSLSQNRDLWFTLPPQQSLLVSWLFSAIPISCLIILFFNILFYWCFNAHSRNLYGCNFSRNESLHNNLCRLLLTLNHYTIPSKDWDLLVVSSTQNIIFPSRYYSFLSHMSSTKSPTQIFLLSCFLQAL